MQTLILPKIHSAQDLHYVSRHIHQISQKHPHETPLRIVPSIESARALWNLGAIAGWQSEHGALQGGAVSGLLVRCFVVVYCHTFSLPLQFAAEDCKLHGGDKDVP